MIFRMILVLNTFLLEHFFFYFDIKNLEFLYFICPDKLFPNWLLFFWIFFFPSKNPYEWIFFQNYIYFKICIIYFFFFLLVLYHFFRSIRTCNKKLTRQQTAQPKTVTQTKLREELFVPEFLYCITFIPLTKLTGRRRKNPAGNFNRLRRIPFLKAFASFFMH